MVGNKTTGVKIPIEKDQGTYAVQLSVLVPKTKGQINVCEESKDPVFQRHV